MCATQHTILRNEDFDVDAELEGMEDDTDGRTKWPKQASSRSWSIVSLCGARMAENELILPSLFEDIYIRSDDAES